MNNKFKRLYCGQGNYLFEVLSMLIVYIIFKFLISIYHWGLFNNFEGSVFVLSIAFGRIIFVLIDYILYNKICEGYSLTSKMMSLGTTLLLVFGSLMILKALNENYKNVQLKTKNIERGEVKLNIYKGKKPNGNRKLKYKITIYKTLNINNLEKNKISKINLTKDSIKKLNLYINRLNNIPSIEEKGFSYPYDLNIDIRTSKNLIVFSLFNLEFGYLSEEDQKIIRDFLSFVKAESNNSINLSLSKR